MAIKETIKKIAGERGVGAYHYLSSQIAALYFGYPSKNLITIGVVGTKGKTSTANFIWACLQQAGLGAAMLSTANIRMGQKETLNQYHMTMPRSFIIQRFFNKTLKEKLPVAIIEATSEGIKQWRHKGISFDFLVFTNLSPEHLPSHGNSFERYQKTKGKVFGGLADYPDKYLAGRDIKKTIIANIDDPNSQYFLGFKAEQKFTFGIKNKADYQATNLENKEDRVNFMVDGRGYQLNIIGDFNVYNALPAIIICELLGNITYEQVRQGLFGLKSLPGRMEPIGQGQNFRVLVDYAHEPKSMALALGASRNLVKEGGRLIVLLGAEGGGRDKAKRPKMGEIASQLADVAVVSNVDPYDDDPKEIIKDIAVAAIRAGKKLNDNIFVIENRREGIKKCLAMAGAGDVVLITGKGAEQSMVIKGTKIPWDDREIVKEELKNMLK